MGMIAIYLENVWHIIYYKASIKILYCVAGNVPVIIWSVL